MKLVIAGSRSIDPLAGVGYIKSIMYDFYHHDRQDNLAFNPLDITEVVSGKAVGMDTAGELWAAEAYAFNAEDAKGIIPVVPFVPDWDNVDVPGAVVKFNKYGDKYNALAGHDRNRKMAEYADAALVIMLKGGSPGSRNMISQMKKLNKPVYVYEV